MTHLISVLHTLWMNVSVSYHLTPNSWTPPGYGCIRGSPVVAQTTVIHKNKRSTKQPQTTQIGFTHTTLHVFIFFIFYNYILFGHFTLLAWLNVVIWYFFCGYLFLFSVILHLHPGHVWDGILPHILGIFTKLKNVFAWHLDKY